MQQLCVVLEPHLLLDLMRPLGLQRSTWCIKIFMEVNDCSERELFVGHGGEQEVFLYPRRREAVGIEQF